MIRVQRISDQTMDQKGLFARVWDTLCGLVEGLFTRVEEVEADIVTVTATAAAAAAAAAAASALANTKVAKDFGSAWSAPTSIGDRSAYVTVLNFTVSNPPTQSEVEDIGSAVIEISEALTALIIDLRANHTLTN